MSISADLRGRTPLGQLLRHDHRPGRADAFLLFDAVRYTADEILYIDGGYIIQ